MMTTPVSATIERLAAQGHLIGDGWRSSAAGGSFAGIEEFVRRKSVYFAP
jgi:hypothetical protein